MRIGGFRPVGADVDDWHNPDQFARATIGADLDGAKPRGGADGVVQPQG